ncbi:MAG: tRNA (adenosine(37)-N6)-dimethylallyltransferase MiaA [Candidatus Dependentiae bacterium]|nr:tRNA (adenosine(37)-N6)-dimethylallyltransferase MiaA [Candidatus Dependentiae bacterium]
MKTVCIIILGPTAVGKTAISLELAAAINGEIINGDLGQCYAPLTVGTAKPAWKTSDIPHHLFDILDMPRSWSVVEYRQKVIEQIKDCAQRGKIPLVVGGSGFYIKSLITPVQHEEGKPLDDIFQNRSTQDLWQELRHVDPDRAQAIHPHDRYRIIRALTIWHQTGKKPSEYTLKYEKIADYTHIIFLERDRSDLYHRIEERATEMLRSGFIEEVESLDAHWRTFVCLKKIIGYEEVLSYIKKGDFSEQALQKLKEQIVLKTKQYAKRQITYNRMLINQLLELQKQHHELVIDQVNLTISDVTLYLEQIVHKILSIYNEL